MILRILASFFLVVFSLSKPSSLIASSSEKAPPAAIVIFGATGDLTARKVLPAIYQLAEEGDLSAGTVVIGVGRRDYSSLKFRELMREGIEKLSKMQVSDEKWKAFEKKLFYHRADFDAEEGFEELKAVLKRADFEWGTNGNRVFYLATHSNSFVPIIQKLSEHGLLYDAKKEEGKWSKVILEKPFGRDLKSALQLQEKISKYLDDSQIYHIDHYLGKAAVQDLFSLRFKNTVFEPLWNNRYIDHVQITISEEIGIGTRGQFWEETGLLRDIFQNHMMQLLSIVAMEPPASLQAEEIHAEKVKLLKSVRPFSAKEIDRYIVRAQYGPGESKGQALLGYRQEKGVAEGSTMETFAAAKLFIENDRWRGVPFYLRSGKRLDVQVAEVVISFKNSPNELWIRIQPRAGVFLRLASTAPGLVHMGYELDANSEKPSREAYEKLLLECILGDRSSFVDAKEQIAAWEILTPVIEHWKNSAMQKIPEYAAGSEGPKEAGLLIAEDGRRWMRSREKERSSPSPK